MIPFTFPLPYREPRYTRAELMEMVEGVDPLVLSSWSNRGQITFDGGNPGRGQRRLYSAADVLQVAIVTQLTGFCVGVDAAVKAAGICLDWTENHKQPSWWEYFKIPSPAYRFERNLAAPAFFSGHAYYQVLGVAPFSDTLSLKTFLQRDLYGDRLGGELTERSNRLAALQSIVDGQSRSAVVFFPIGWIVNTALLRIIMREATEDESILDRSGLRAFIEGESGE